MNTASEIVIEAIQFVLITIIFVTGNFFKKAWKSSDAFFEEKAKNYATKQDIQDITTKTEQIQNKFKEELVCFEKDLQFKYNLYEKQYTELYADLYLLLSKSNAIKNLFNAIDDEIDLTEVSIVEYQGESESSILVEMLELIERKKEYATPLLVEVSSNLVALKNQYDTGLLDENYNNIQNDLKKKLSKIIVQDYNSLRKHLQLPIV